MKDCGGMAERLKAAVLKTAEARASVGSNPTPSARLGGDTPPTLGGDTPQRITRNRNVPLGSVPLWTPWECPRRTGEVAESAEGNRLLSGCTGKTVPRVRIPPSPPRFSTTGDPGIRTGDAADEQEEKRDFRSASGGDEAGRAMAWTAEPNAGESLPLRHGFYRPEIRGFATAGSKRGEVSELAEGTRLEIA